MKKKKILICGATGFIGRNIAEYYSKMDEYEVFGVYNKRPRYDCENLNWIKADLTQSNDIDMVLKNGFDIVVQAAATTSGSKDIVSRPYIHVTDNAVMNSLLFRSSYED